MRIGIDGACLANRRGFGRFTRELLRAVAAETRGHEIVVFLDRPSLESVEIPSAFETVVVDVKESPTKAASAKGRRRIGDMLAMGKAVAGNRLDLIYFPASYSFFPVWNARRVVVTLHDTLALEHPELVFSSRAGRLAWKAKEHLAVTLADRIVTVSETSKRDLIRWFKLRPDRVVAITEGPDPVFRPQPEVKSAEVLRKFGIDPGRRYLLYVGGLSPHKNLERLIEAFGRLDGPNVQLVIVGDFGDVFLTNVNALREAVARSGLDRSVTFTGYVPDHELVHLYSRAYALVQPSLMEGFGLPAVEAMACGTPVVCSTAGSLPEVVGDAGLFFDPTDTAAIADQLTHVLNHPEIRKQLALRATERATRFTWRAAADLLMNCLEEVVWSDQGGRASA